MIVCSDKEAPQIAADTKELAFVPRDSSYNGHVIEYHFYDTTINVFVYPKDKPDLKREAEIQYIV